jgi:hypothetical protein
MRKYDLHEQDEIKRPGGNKLGGRVIEYRYAHHIQTETVKTNWYIKGRRRGQLNITMKLKIM